MSEWRPKNESVMNLHKHWHEQRRSQQRRHCRSDQKGQWAAVTAAQNKCFCLTTAIKFSRKNNLSGSLQ